MDSFHGYRVMLGWLLNSPLSLRNVQSILTHIQLYNTRTHSPTDAQSEIQATAVRSNRQTLPGTKLKNQNYVKDQKLRRSPNCTNLLPTRTIWGHTYKLTQLCCVWSSQPTQSAAETKRQKQKYQSRLEQSILGQQDTPWASARGSFLFFSSTSCSLLGFLSLFFNFIFTFLLYFIFSVQKISVVFFWLHCILCHFINLCQFACMHGNILVMFKAFLKLFYILPYALFMLMSLFISFDSITQHSFNSLKLTFVPLTIFFRL